jgi:hypothetical protein
MSRAYKDNKNKPSGNTSRRIIVRPVRRDRPDTRKLARAIIALVQAQAEAEAARNASGLPASKDLTNPKRPKSRGVLPETTGE